MRRMPRRAVLILLVLNAVAAFAISLYAWANPRPNWDIVPYAALADVQPGMADADLLRRTNDDVRRHLGDAGYEAMVKADAYASRIDADPAALKDTLRFYEVKPLYVWLTRGLRPLTGDSGAAAAALVSALSLALLVAVMPWFFRGLEVPLLAILWFFMVWGDPPWWPAGSLATPDTLAMLLVTACALAALAGRHAFAATAAALLSVLARPDSAFLVVPLLAGMAWIERREPARRRHALAWLAGALAVFAAFVVLGRMALPWTTLFSHTFIAREAFPSTIRYEFQWADYVAAIRRALPLVFYWRPLAFLALGIALAALSWHRARRLTPVSLFALCGVASMLLHYAVFPVAEFPFDRMFFVSYPVLIAALMLWLRERRAPA
jgi:hypothetical protein